MNGLRSAISFLTILPLAPRNAPNSMASARGWFPLVGLLLGLILAGVDILRMLMLQAGSSDGTGGMHLSRRPLPSSPTIQFCCGRCSW